MVKLASGGEVMVAETAGGWRCVWHNKKDKKQSDIYTEAILRKPSDRSVSPAILVDPQR